MATNRSYTNIEQSKVLAEILPLESADMHYSKDFDGSWFVDLAEYTSVKIPKYVGNVEEHLLPCWSLAALLDVLPSIIKRKEKRMFLTLEKAGAYNLYYKSPNRLDELWETKEEPIDACYEMILKLHEFNLL